MDKIAVVSPGLLPVPPILGGSVETVIQKMAEQSQRKFGIDIISPANRALPAYEHIGQIKYHRFASRPYSQYFKSARSFLAGKNYSIIQVENRPLFIPKTKLLKPESRFICSLHSLLHIEDRLIRPALTEKIFNQCDCILVYSRYMLNRLAARFPRAAEKLRYIHLATDSDTFRPRWSASMEKTVRGLRLKHGIPEDFKVVLFAGRIIPEKGVHILLAAMQQVVSAFPKCCLVVVGSGWYGNRSISPYIRELRLKSESIANKIVFTNYVSVDKMPGYYAMADVFVCPSQWEEPFGLVNVEAMASGVPVVASAKGGIPEIISDRIEGILVDKAEDPSAFAGPILELLNNSDLAVSFGKNGREKAENYFNWTRAGKEITALYQSLLI